VIELKTTTTPENIGMFLLQNIPRQTPLLSQVVIFLSLIIVSNPNWQFVDCDTIAFSEQYDAVIITKIALKLLEEYILKLVVTYSFELKHDMKSYNK
jgi:hypothetical protein